MAPQAMASQAMAPRKPTKAEFLLHKAWHAWLAGGFAVAYLTADEDTYAMHVFSGYAVLAAVAVRLLVGLMADERSPWRLPRPSLGALRTWLSQRKGRHPLFAWFAVALVAIVGASAVSGALADSRTWLEDIHEGISEASLWVVFGHVAFVALIFGGKSLLSRLLPRLSKETP